MQETFWMFSQYNFKVKSNSYNMQSHKHKQIIKTDKAVSSVLEKLSLKH